MSNKYKKDAILSRLFFVVDHVEKIFQTSNYNDVSVEEVKKIYLQHFEPYENFAIRIIVENIKNTSQIKSMYFQKNKKATD